uniref:CPBP family intramembrane glutamic endopeptidase n=1 Tax=Anaerococcus mediterraneensis TaxID=1870984 RepID=UPI000931CD62|nr:CPBP family intramembrane glutamic endopeptidase [Anaerococcus mediterraneensis]
MIANKSIKETRDKSFDLNPVIVTIFLSLAISLPQLGFIKLIDMVGCFDKLMASTDIKNLIILYLTSISLGLAYLFAKKILKRTDLSLGLVNDRKLRSYGVGVFLGIGLIILISLILWAFGFAEISKNNMVFDKKIFIFYIVGWMIQGFEEEFLLRSILMNQLGSRGKISLAIIANSFIFSILHLSNSGFTFLAFVNLSLIGIIFSLLFYMTDSIYISAGAHSFWNMAMANIFGIVVSGDVASPVTILNTRLKGNSLVSGGSFGLEASIVTSLVFIIVLLILIRKIKNRPCD